MDATPLLDPPAAGSVFTAVDMPQCTDGTRSSSVSKLYWPPRRSSSAVGADVEKNALNTVNGVFVPCLLNILGAVLFLRIGYSVGYAGIIWTCIIFAVSFSTTVLTALSFSAIVTNGKMQGGGPYYMISRSIGPAFGGATGLMFWFCYVFNATFNTTAFVEDIRHTVIAHAGEDAWPSWAFPVLYHGTLCVLFGIAWVGAGCFSKVNTLLFVTLVTAILVTFFSLIFGDGGGSSGRIISPHAINCSSDPDSIMDYSDPWYQHHLVNATFYGPSAARFRTNLWPRRDAAGVSRDQILGEWDVANNLQVIVALIFTSTCGVLEGANLSGDLKNPARSLPKGTLFAQLTAFIVYTAFACLMAASFDRDSLRCNYFLLQEISVSEYFVVVGMAMATLSTSLGAFFGGSRVLQAIARDNLFPYLGYFAKGTKKGDEPRRAVFFTWVLANGFGYIGGSAVNGIAAILTDFFLTAYLFVNVSALMLFLTNAPNWRPTFTFTKWWMSLGGAMMAIFMMFYLDWWIACITTGIWAFLFVFLRFRVGETAHRDWGDIGQAILYRLLRQNTLDLHQQKDNPKFWRSNILFLAETVDVPALRFCRSVTQEGMGLFMIGTAVEDSVTLGSPAVPSQGRARKKSESIVLEGPVSDHLAAGHRGISTPAARVKAAWSWIIASLKLDAFSVVATGKKNHAVETYATLISSAGLGGLVPRTVAIPFGRLPNNAVVDSVTEEGNTAHLGRSPTKSFVMDSYIRGVIQRPPISSSRNSFNQARAKKHHKSWQTFRENPGEFNHTLDLGGATAQIEMIKRVLDMQMNVMLLRDLDKFDERLDALGNGTMANARCCVSPPLSSSSAQVAWIDVWVPFELPANGLADPLRALAGSDLSLLLQYGHLLARAHAGKRHNMKVRLRLVQACDRSTSDEDMETMQQCLLYLADEARIPDAGTLVVRCPHEGGLEFTARPSVAVYGQIGQFIAMESSCTVMTFLALPPLPPRARDVDSSELWMQAVDALSGALPPTVLCRKGEPMDVLSFAI